MALLAHRIIVRGFGSRISTPEGKRIGAVIGIEMRVVTGSALHPQVTVEDRRVGRVGEGTGSKLIQLITDIARRSAVAIDK